MSIPNGPDGMNKTIQLTIQCYGALRKMAQGGVLTLNIPAPMSVGALKKHIDQTLQSTLAEDSALADSERMLGDEEMIGQSSTLAILPPVCGG